MTTPKSKFAPPTFDKRILIIVGGYGSGKSEVAVNLARYLVENSGRKIAIGDLDVVNPYFRSREANRVLQDLGIKPLHPVDTLAHADLPIILPGVKGAVEEFDGTVILDVGGDDVGARVLGSITDAMPIDDHDLLLVLNANRPHTNDVESCKLMMQKIQAASRLRFTGIISNTHMMEHTTANTVREGLRLARAVSEETGLPISFVSALDEHLKKIKASEIDVPVLQLDRLLLKPWERPTRRTGQ